MRPTWIHQLPCLVSSSLVKIRNLVNKSSKTVVSISRSSILVKLGFRHIIKAGCHVSQMAETLIPSTEKKIFGTGPGSAIEEEAEPNSREYPQIKSRGAPAECVFTAREIQACHSNAVLSSCESDGLLHRQWQSSKCRKSTTWFEADNRMDKKRLESWCSHFYHNQELLE